MLYHNINNLSTVRLPKAWSRAVKSRGSTDWEMVRAAVPARHRAAAYWTWSLIRTTLVVVSLGKLHQLEPLGLKGAVVSSGGTSWIRGVRAAEPIQFRGHRATATWTWGHIRITLSSFWHLDQLFLVWLYLITSSESSQGKYYGKSFHLEVWVAFQELRGILAGKPKIAHSQADKITPADLNRPCIKQNFFCSSTRTGGVHMHSSVQTNKS